MHRLPQVLICDDDSTFHLAVKYSLKSKYECRSAYNGDEALAIIRNQPIDLILLDVSMRSADEGLKFIPQFREADDLLAIIMTSGNTEFHTVKEAMRLGAADYIPKDFDPDNLIHTIQRVLERRNLLQRHEQQNFETVLGQKRHILVGNSPAIKELKQIIAKIRISAINVVIQGETGTGKEVIARQLRNTLPDGSLAPFVAVDSSTIQSSMAESILFGHEKGAFTGADKQSKGIFEEANGGIVYFDEIANMPLQIQSKLLRVLQEKEVVRLGSSKVIPLDFRVVCATNKDLEEMTRTGQFKDDLLQRLNVVTIKIPPLRDRTDDIPLLVEHFCTLNPRGSEVLSFTEDAINELKNYSWPGNIRELGNLVAYISAMAVETNVDVADLPPKIRDAARSSRPESETPSIDPVINFYKAVADFEKSTLLREYLSHDGNVSKMSLALGMDRSHLHTKLKEYGIHSKRAKN